MDAEASQIVLLKDCLQKQLDELSMLQSIYYNPGELQQHDPTTTADISEFINGKVAQIYSKLSFTINLVAEEHRNKIEIHVELPHLYPTVESASVILRCADFGRVQEKTIKTLIDEYITTECDSSDTYVFQVVSWIQDNLEMFRGLTSRDPEETKSNDSGIDVKSSAGQSTITRSGSNEVIEYERLWIYSHHIKSKTKRQNIVKEAKNLNLTGFLRPGKPGIICVEGQKDDTQEFWSIIRQYNWQKIQVRHSEVKVKPIDCNFSRFEGFKEQLFTAKDDDDMEVPMDMRLFMKFLEQHNSTYVKEFLFGF